jgi:hypothetical protein
VPYEEETEIKLAKRVGLKNRTTAFIRLPIGS